MVALAWVISLIAVYYLGYSHAALLRLIKSIKISTEKKQAPPKPVESLSTIVDPLDMIQNAKWEYEQQLKAMNPTDEQE